MKNKLEEENLWCEYSDLPSPLAYTKCMDYDSMGNHGRFPKNKQEREKKMKRIVQKFVFWILYKFTRKKRKSIWKL